MGNGVLRAGGVGNGHMQAAFRIVRIEKRQIGHRRENFPVPISGYDSFYRTRAGKPRNLIPGMRTHPQRISCK